MPDAVPGIAGGKALWGVPDLRKEIERLAAAGVTTVGPVMDVGGGILVADLTDPFGNVVGLIENPHFSAANVR
jgi:predicted enzyme related to lactoylglutathione lyase